MPINSQPKRFDMRIPGRVHLIGTQNQFVCTQAWIDANPSAVTEGGATDLYIAGNNAHGPDGTDMVLDHPIAYIKAVAEEIQQDSTGEAFYQNRILVRLGTLDERMAGVGWTKIAKGTQTTVKDVWYIDIYMDEADHMEGNFDYVELQNDGDDSGILCYEYIY